MSRNDLPMSISPIQPTIPLQINIPQNKVHHNSTKQQDSQGRRSIPIIKSALRPRLDILGPQLVYNDGVNHGNHGDAGEEEGGDYGGGGGAEV